jgi:periplasmic divalent cation tolerance protein
MSSKYPVTVAYCTFPDEATAARICEILVFEGTIACANIFAPHRAIYEWNGTLRNHMECAALLKLNSRKREILMERIRAEHPYETPAVVFYDPAGGLPEFLKWVYAQSL